MWATVKTNERNETYLTGAGQTLFSYSKSAEFTARRGLVWELWPFIYGASERMSAKDISHFLEAKQGIKLSSVTINKALKDPVKSWNLFFDTIEPAARIFEREDKKRMRDFLFKEQIFWKPFESPLLQAAAKAVTPADVRWAAGVLRGKWYTIDLEIRLKARPFIEHRLNK